MKMKKKGKVYPTQSSPSFKDPHSVLKLLPVTILALASSLPPHDQEVLAYIIARSIFETTTNPSFFSHNIKNKCKKKPTTSNVQKNPLFECGCFDCYTCFWYRWDSSPNRELIHQVIEAFEEHLLVYESSKKQNRGKKRDKVMMGSFESDILEKENGKTEIFVAESECEEEVIENESDCEEEEMVVGGGEVTENLEMAVVTVQGPWSSSVNKGLARKVLPDVMGLFNSRLWSLWSPGI